MNLIGCRRTPAEMLVDHDALIPPNEPGELVKRHILRAKLGERQVTVLESNIRINRDDVTVASDIERTFE